jgi:hypothetical protein
MARERGIYMKARRGENLPISKRDNRVDGLRLWWFDPQWRVEK